MLVQAAVEEGITQLILTMRQRRTPLCMPIHPHILPRVIVSAAATRPNWTARLPAIDVSLGATRYKCPTPAPLARMLAIMSDTLALAGAIGGIVAAAVGIIAAVGAWRTEITARWQARVEQLRTDTARRENELHRERFTEIWHWWNDQPDGPKRINAARWYTEWTGTARPFRSGKDDGPLAPGFGCANADEAYDIYIGFLDALYHPGRLGPPRLSLSEADTDPVP